MLGEGEEYAKEREKVRIYGGMIFGKRCILCIHEGSWGSTWYFG